MGSESSVELIRGTGWSAFVGRPEIGMHLRASGYAGLGDTLRVLIDADDERSGVLDLEAAKFEKEALGLLESLKFMSRAKKTQPKKSSTREIRVDVATTVYEPPAFVPGCRVMCHSSKDGRLVAWGTTGSDGSVYLRVPVDLGIVLNAECIVAPYEIVNTGASSYHLQDLIEH